MDLIEDAKKKKKNDGEIFIFDYILFDYIYFFYEIFVDEKYDKVLNENKIKQKELQDLKEKLPILEIEMAEFKQKSKVDIVQLKQKLQVEIDNLKQEIIQTQNKIKDCENKLKENLSEKRRDYYEDMIKIYYTEVNHLRESLQNKENYLINEIKEKEKDLINGLKSKENNLRNEIKKMENELTKKENEIYDEIWKLPNKKMSLKNEINHLSNLMSKGNILLLSSFHFFLYFYIIFCRC